MDNKIREMLVTKINDYENLVGDRYRSNSAMFSVFDSFFHKMIFDNEEAIKYGISNITIIRKNLISNYFNIDDYSSDPDGIACHFDFDGIRYVLNFTKYREGIDMVYFIGTYSNKPTKYSSEYIYKYMSLSALKASTLKGSYITMPGDSFEWEVKEIEPRDFGDIFLPTNITKDLKLFVDIYEKSGTILRYLKVGNPGTGKTESTLVIANELNKKGVTIIKTPICEYFHQKVELANILAPSLIILDDIDLSLGGRGGGHSRLLGDFLDVLDGTDKLSDNVGIIATTNAANLLDIAAQRPGRFNKTLLFDDLAESNIKDIISKCLRKVFKLDESKEPETYKYFTDSRIVDMFYKAGVSGSHVFNSIKMLKLRYDTLDGGDLNLNTILDDIKEDLEILEKVKKSSYLSDKYEREEHKSTIGFSRNNNSKREVLEQSEPTPIKEYKR